LTELRLADANRHGIVGRDDDPRIDLRNLRLSVPGCSRRGDFHCIGTARPRETSHQRAADYGRRDEELTAILDMGRHRLG